MDDATPELVRGDCALRGIGADIGRVDISHAGGDLGRITTAGVVA